VLGDSGVCFEIKFSGRHRRFDGDGFCPKRNYFFRPKMLNNGSTHKSKLPLIIIVAP